MEAQEQPHLFQAEGTQVIFSPRHLTKDLRDFPLISTEIPLPASKGDQTQESQIQAPEMKAQNNSLIFPHFMLHFYAFWYVALETRGLVSLAERGSLKIQVLYYKFYLP